MPRFTVEVDGQQQLAGALRVWQERKRLAVAALLTTYAGLIAAAAKQDAPRGASGRLQGSIEAHVERVLADLVADVAAGVFYARFLEHGTSALAARPFLQPAFERYSRAYYDELRSILSS